MKGERDVAGLEWTSGDLDVTPYFAAHHAVVYRHDGQLLVVGGSADNLPGGRVDDDVPEMIDHLGRTK